MTEDLQPVILPGTAPPPSLAGAPDGGDADACPRGGWAAPEDLELAGCLKRIGGGDEEALAELYDTTVLSSRRAHQRVRVVPLQSTVPRAAV